MSVRFFAVNKNGNRNEIRDLYWFEENGVHTFNDKSYGGETVVVELPVPRCETCKHWGPLVQPAYIWSNCELLSTGSVVSTEGDEIIQTRADFGCVRWEAK